MEERSAGRVDLTAVQLPGDRGGSRPKPPKAGARSARLEPNRDHGKHQKAKRPLTSKTVAQPPRQRPTTGMKCVTGGVSNPFTFACSS